MRVKSSTLFIIALILLFIGVVMVATTAYQELVEEPNIDPLDPEGYHMGVQVAKYEWRSRAPVITSIGGILIIIGVLIIVSVLLLDWLQDLI